jgi:AraC family transcriptional regulator
MRQELEPSTIVRTSDFSGFAGLRVVIREKQDGSYGSGRRGTSFFLIGYRPGEERGRVTLRFQAQPAIGLLMTRASMALTRASVVIPAGQPFEADYVGAAGKMATFEIEPCFLAEVVRRAGIMAAKLERLPPARFLINERVDQLCSLLIRETEHQAPASSLYFEGLATALVIAVVSQTDVRLAEAGNLHVQHERIQKALAYIEANFRSKLTRSQMAAAAHLSDFHFSRLFRRLVGLSPEAYLLDCRLRYAQKLLVLHRPGSSIADVAAAAGFADQSHFGRQFRRVFGLSPHEFRQQREHK